MQPDLTSKEQKTITRSLQAWQKGETSDGKHLLKAAKKYAQKHGDPFYLEAVKLFIKEEQKHGENLGKYLDSIGEKRLGFDWGDHLFRTVRYFNSSMEIWTITVIIVESFAQLYYKALADATNCQLLKAICNDILKDEAHHIRFQYERLATIIGKRRFLSSQFTYLLYFVLFGVIITAIWIAGHRKVYRAGGLSWTIYISKACKKFFGLLEKLERLRKKEPEVEMTLL